MKASLNTGGQIRVKSRHFENPQLAPNATAADFCEVYRPVVVKSISRRLLGADPEDLTHVVFAEFLTKWRFAFESTRARRYLWGIVRNQIRLQYSRRNQKEFSSDDIEKFTSALEVATPTRFDEILTPFEVSFAQDTAGMTNAEAAQHYGLSESTIKRRKAIIADKLYQSKQVVSIDRFKKTKRTSEQKKSSWWDDIGPVRSYYV